MSGPGVSRVQSLGGTGTNSTGELRNLGLGNSCLGRGLWGAVPRWHRIQRLEGLGMEFCEGFLSRQGLSECVGFIPQRNLSTQVPDPRNRLSKAPVA